MKVPPLDPLLEKLDCWPLSLPATLMRSTWTPGIVCRMTHGSREVGIAFNSSCVTAAPVCTFRVSSSGASPVTVTVAATFESDIWIVNSVSLPRETVRFSRLTVPKFESANVTV